MLRNRPGSGPPLRAALESMVLLDNSEGLVPLEPESLSKVAVIGPAADDPRLAEGDYHYPAHLEIDLRPRRLGRLVGGRGPVATGGRRLRARALHAGHRHTDGRPGRRAGRRRRSAALRRLWSDRWRARRWGRISGGHEDRRGRAPGRGVRCRGRVPRRTFRTHAAGHGGRGTRCEQPRPHRTAVGASPRNHGDRHPDDRGDQLGSRAHPRRGRGTRRGHIARLGSGHRRRHRTRAHPAG